MTVTHLDSPRIELDEQKNRIAGQLEYCEEMLRNLRIGSSILSSDVRANASIVSEIIEPSSATLDSINNKRLQVCISLKGGLN